MLNRLFSVIVLFTLVHTSVISQVSAPNKTDKKGLRTGKWIYYYDQNDNLLENASGTSWYRIAKFKKDKPQGVVYDYYADDNSLIYAAEFSALLPDTLNGYATLYYKNGNKKYVYQYVKGVMQGIAQQFYESGNLQWQCNYTNNFPDGIYTEYFDNGNMMRTGPVVLGKKNGKFNFYNSNGILEKTTVYVDDLRNGPSENFDSAGIKTAEFPYKDNMLTGVIKYYRPNGEVKKCVMYYQDSIMDLYDIITASSLLIASGNTSEESFAKAFILEEYFRYTYGEENALYGFAAGLISQLYFLKGDAQNGLPWTTKAYNLDKTFIGTEDEPSADNWHLYSIIFSTYNENALAMEATEFAIESSKINGLPTSVTLTYMDRMAAMQITLDNYEAGFSQYEKLLDVCDQMGDSVSYDCTLYGLQYVSYLSATFQPQRALAQLGRVAKMAEGTGLEFQVQYETGKADIDLNRVEDGLTAFKKVYDNFGTAQTDTILHLDVVRKLANYYAETGNYAAAEKMFLESVDVSKNIAQADSSDYFSRMMDIAEFYTRVGRYDKAIPLAEQATAFRVRELGYEKNNFFDFLTNDLLYSNFTAQLVAMGRIYEVAEMAESATFYYQQASDFALTNEGDSSFNYINATAALAGMAMQAEHYAESEKLYDQALTLSEKYLGAKNINYQTWRDDVSELYIRMNRYADALTIAEEVMAFRKENYNENDPLVLASYRRLASIYDALGNADKARELYVRNLQVQLQQLNTNFSVMNAVEREEFLSTFRYQFDVFNDFAFAHQNLDGIAGDLYNFQLANRAMLLYSATNARRNFEQSPDPQIRNTYTDWLHTKQFISKLETQPGWDPQFVDSLKSAADTYEKKLSLLAGSNISYVVNTKWNDVQSQLADNEAIVDFMSISSFSDTIHSGYWYAAIILTRNMQTPQFVVLCNEADLLQIVTKKDGETDAAYSARLYGYPEYADEEEYFDGQHLYALLWKPLEQYIDEGQTIYVTVSGALNTLNISAIPLAFNAYAGFTYHIVQTGNAAELKKMHADKSITAGSVAVIGGVDYMSPDEKLYAALESHGNLISAEELLLNDSRNAAGTRGGNWNYLPGTLQEVKTINKLLQTAKDTIAMYTGSNASEDNFKSFSGNAPEIMHISTHGFFTDQLPGNSISQSDAMYRSGLLLAGGNRSWQGEQLPNDLNDGILTAAEVSFLDLSNCKLAVLSACETGLGAVRSDEGVFGLQRAFKLAGVENIIMSLWKVSDTETALFMEYFYSNMMQGMDLDKAFRNAQLTMSKRYGPYYWAAFILLQ